MRAHTCKIISVRLAAASGTNLSACVQSSWRSLRPIASKKSRFQKFSAYCVNNCSITRDQHGDQKPSNPRQPTKPKPGGSPPKAGKKLLFRCGEARLSEHA